MILRSIPFVAATVGLLLLSATSVDAHERSNSFVSYHLDAEGADVTLGIGTRDLTRLPQSALGGGAGEVALADALTAAVLARRGGEDCAPDSRAIRTGTSAGRVSFAWRVSCPQAGPFEVESRLPQLLRVPHLCFLRVLQAGADDQEVVLHSDRRQWRQQEAAQGFPGWLDSFRLGLGHIGSGLDHLLFVFGLVLGAVTLSEVATVVTAFTLAHTLTLAAATLGFLQPFAPAVESLIAASIALLAVENLTLRSSPATAVSPRRPPGPPPPGRKRKAWLAAMMVLTPALAASALGFGRVAFSTLAGTGLFGVCYLAFAERRPDNRRVRWLVAFVFGLLHGFGFAGILLESGFSGAGVAATLVAFNLGVEAGQLLFVAAMWPLLGLAKRSCGEKYARLVMEPAAVVLLSAAVGWYATRTYG